jgi:hypothetical protein
MWYTKSKEEALMTFGSWVWACKGKKQPGESRVVTENGLHSWMRNEDHTATCKRCGMVLSVEEANDCFRRW